MTLDGPPLVALTFDDGPRSSTTGPLPDKPGYEDLRKELLAKL